MQILHFKIRTSSMESLIAGYPLFRWTLFLSAVLLWPRLYLCHNSGRRLPFASSRWSGSHVMVWDAIGFCDVRFFYALTDIWSANGTSTGRWVQLWSFLCRTFHGLHTNRITPLQVARDALAFLTRHNILLLSWPARSPDLSSIEHICFMITRYSRLRSPQVQLMIFGIVPKANGLPYPKRASKD